MPNSSLHMSFATDAAKVLDHPLLQDYRGSYILGSTAPDIRNLAGWDRYKTHFFDLKNDSPGKSIDGLFEHHPELAEAANLGNETKAFVLGYMSHLITDETWIADVYRPYFGLSSDLYSDPLGNVLDRVLQFELDRQERSCLADINEVVSQLEEGDVGVEVNFIEPTLLAAWKGIMRDRTTSELGWEHLRRFANKALPEEIRDDEGAMESIIRSAPNLLKRVQSLVPKKAIDSFRSKAISDFILIGGEYLS